MTSAKIPGLNKQERLLHELNAGMICAARTTCFQLIRPILFVVTPTGIPHKIGLVETNRLANMPKKGLGMILVTVRAISTSLWTEGYGISLRRYTGGA